MGEHGLRVEDYTRVRALVGLIIQMKALLEGRKEEVEDEIGEQVVSGTDHEADSIRARPFLSSQTSEAGSAICSEYTVRSISSWKERTSWFFRPASACGNKQSAAQMSCH